MDGLFVGFGGIMIVFFVLFGLLFVGVLTFIIVVAVRNAQKARAAGYDPLTMQTELTTKAMSSELLTPARTVEQRLAELDALRARGVITAQERETARAEILRG